MAEASRVFNSALLPNFPPLQKTHSTKPYTATFRRHSINCSVSTSDSARVTVAGPIPWGCDIDSLENASALQKWLSQSGLPDQKMAIQRVEVGERGLVALKNVRKGEKLLFVPPSLVISADSVCFPDWKFLECENLYELLPYPFENIFVVCEVFSKFCSCSFDCVAQLWCWFCNQSRVSLASFFYQE